MKLVGIELQDKAIPRAGYPVELEDGTHKQVKFLSLTPAGMSFDPDAPDAE